MKRSPLARSSSLERGKPLNRRKWPLHASGLKTRPAADRVRPIVPARSQAVRRKGLAKVGKRAKRERKASDAFRVAVLERAGGRCERCGKRPRQPGDLHAHHIARRMGNATHVLENGAALCAGPPDGGCHRKVHERAVPDWEDWIR